MSEKNPYERIINMPHHVSQKHPQMSLYDRAAQFSSFAALTGHSDAIEETARLTDFMIRLDESQTDLINNKLSEIMNKPRNERNITLTYFKPDSKKSGGAYVTVKSKIKAIDTVSEKIIFTDGTEILAENIIDIKESDCDDSQPD